MKKILTLLPIAYCLLPIAYCLLPIASCLLPIASLSQSVGIGTTNPAFKLDVRNGSINVDSGYRIGTITVLSGPGDGNLFIGKDAGRINTGRFNTFSGDLTGYSNTTGMDNSFFGRTAGYFNTTGSSNTFFGVLAGFANTTGYWNSFYGRNSVNPVLLPRKWSRLQKNSVFHSAVLTNHKTKKHYTVCATAIL
jgi:hypothetical protein